jgi:hypothetical protein
MSVEPSMGECHLCGGTFNRVSMTRHLSGCSRPEVPPLSATAGDREFGHAFHLFVEGRDVKAYWMHLAIPAEAPLSKLDRFLRRTWLECCGHLSVFAIGGNRYVSQPMEELELKGMGVRLSRVLELGLKFSYEYDYGSTTELTLKVVALRDQRTARGAVQLLARNVAPQVTCQRCTAQLATHICTECAWSGTGWLCEACAVAHKCGTEMCLPVVNSPRAGVCAYTG